MRQTIRFLLLLPFLLGVMALATSAWEADEHQALATGSLSQAAAECDLPLDLDAPLWQGKSFGALSAWSARHDLRASRYQLRGRSVLTQLAVLKPGQLERILREHARPATSLAEESRQWAKIRSAEMRDHNVLSNYLVHHLIALRYADLAGRRAGGAPAEDRQVSDWRESLDRALCYEAMALGYLTDAFSSGHLLIPDRTLLAPFCAINYRQAHDHYRNTGVYVINSIGEVWQTFGDGLLHWFRPTREHAQDACLTSLRELFVVYRLAGGGRPLPPSLAAWLADQYPAGDGVAMANAWLVAREGSEYYTTLRMPSLLRLPMTATATWSRRLPQPDRHGIHPRRHFPQLRDPGYHDPDLDPHEVRLLHRRRDLPDWLVMAGLGAASPRELIRSDPDVASVWYVQDQRKAPSFVGGLLSVGGGLAIRTPESDGTTSFGIGFGLVDQLIEFRRLPGIHNISLELSYQRRMGDAERRTIAPLVAFQITLPSLPDLHIESGYTWGLKAPYKQRGARAAFGIASTTLPLPLAYMGAMVRLKYQVLYLEEIIDDLMLELVIH